MSVLYEEENRRLQWCDFKTNMSGWTGQRMVDALRLLAQEGEIRFWRIVPVPTSLRWGRTELADISNDEVLAHESADDPFWRRASTLCYGFTEQGGRNWEAAYKPDWSRFDSGGFYGGETKILLICATQQRLYERLGAAMDYYDWDKDFGLQNVRTGVREKWQATYWKQLDYGFFVRASYRLKAPEASINFIPPSYTRSQYLRDLFVRWEDVFLAHLA